MLRFPWIRMQRKTDPELPVETPILLGNKSNGEFFWDQTPRERRMRAEILRRADEGARRLGIDRRDFLASALGMATSLAVVNLFSGCSDGGGFKTPEEPLDCQGATEIISGNEFIFDIQTHHIEDEETWRERHPGKEFQADGFAQFLTLYACDLPDRRDCIGPAQYARLIFLESDTTVATLSGFPSPMCDDGTLCTNLNGNDGMAYWRDVINAAAGSQRMVQHCQVGPNDRWDLQQAMMEQIREQYGNHGWKCYPPWGPDGKGWWLDDEAVGSPFIQKCIDLGEPLICIHKGFPLPGFDREHTDPRDVGPAALRFPNANFVIYHSAFESQNREGPVRSERSRRRPPGAHRHRARSQGQERLRRARQRLGAVDEQRARRAAPDRQAASSISARTTWCGARSASGSARRSRRSRRSARCRSRPSCRSSYGYPELTPAIKQKILGLNAARIYGIDPAAVRCTIDESKLGRARAELDAVLGTRRWAFQQPHGPRTRREFVTLQQFRKAHGRMA